MTPININKNCSENGFNASMEFSVIKRFKASDENDNNDAEIFATPILRSRQVLEISSEAKEMSLSPITTIALNLSSTSIGTPTGRKQQQDTPKINELKCNNTSMDDIVLKRGDLGLFSSDNYMNGSDTNGDDHNCQINKDLITNNFTINSADRNNATHRMESRVRGVQRRLNIAPLSLSYDDDELHEIPPDNGNRMAVDDISFYSSQSPQASPRPCPSSPLMTIGLLSPEGSPQRFTVVQNTVTIVDKRRSTDEIDASSIDSGYETSSFRFVAPQPKLLEPSPRKTCHPQHDMQIRHKQLQLQQNHAKEKRTSPKSFSIFHSLSSGSTESMEDDLMELLDSEQFDEDVSLPSNLNSLISGHIMVKTPEMKRPPVRRCLSLTENTNMQLGGGGSSALFEPKTPEILRPIQNQTTPFSSRNGERCFKRPDPPSVSPIQCKRYKFDEKENKNGTKSSVTSSFLSFSSSSSLLQSSTTTTTTTSVARPILRKSISLNEAHIMTALARSSSEPDLIGDFSKPFCLPLMEGRHQDLKSISCKTMAKLLRGEFSDTVASFKIIDCRYPYEYDGGHIRGAQNLYTQEQVLEELVNLKTEAPEVQEDGPKRHILVFHCEFSSERGPKLSRFLRNRDRLRNTQKYPALHYPEIYLLHGGYKEFFENYSELCDPVAYRPMLDPQFGAAYRQFRAKSKSWNGDIKVSTSANHRLMKSRSRLVL